MTTDHAPHAGFDYTDKQLDRAIKGAEIDLQATRDYLLTLQDERQHRWYMRHVIIEKPTETNQGW